MAGCTQRSAEIAGFRCLQGQHCACFKSSAHLTHSMPDSPAAEAEDDDGVELLVLHQAQDLVDVLAQVIVAAAAAATAATVAAAPATPAAPAAASACPITSRCGCVSRMQGRKATSLHVEAQQQACG